MPYHPDIHRRHSIRLPDFDYSCAGAYFVTVCTYERECLFGEIVDGEMRLNEYGRIVETVWNSLPQKYPDIETDAFVVMPNHIHGIIVVNVSVGAIHELPLHQTRHTRRNMLLPMVIGYLKMNSAKQINAHRQTPAHSVWQGNYYEHVIRNDRDLAAIREYVTGNPAKWAEDENFPVA